MTQWLIFFLSIVCPGLGVASAYSRIDRNATAIEVLTCSVLTSLLFLSLFALTLFATGTWSLEIFNLGTLAFTCASFLILKGKDIFPAFTRNPLSLTVIILTGVLCHLSWGPPPEWITYNNYDAGRYSNHASFMLRTGAIKVDQPLEAKGLLQPSDYHFPKYYFDDPPMTEFQLPYLHLFPAAIAVARVNVGLRDSFRINQFLSFTSLLIFLGLLSRYGFTIWWCCIGIILLGTNPAFLFYAKRNMSEMLALNLTLGFFFFLSLCDEYESKLFAFLSALTLLALATCRLEYGFVYCSVVIALLSLRITLSQGLAPAHACFAISNAVLLAPLGLYYNQHCNFYIFRNTYWHFDHLAEFFEVGWRMSPKFPVAALLIAINALLLFLAVTTFRYSKSRLAIACPSPKLLEIGSKIAAVLIGGFLLYSWFLRPIGSIPGINRNITWEVSKQLSLPRLLYFIDPLSVFATALAAVFSLKYRKSSPFLIAAVFSLILGIVNTNHSAITLGWIRRFLPIVIPGCYLSLLFVVRTSKSWGGAAVLAVLLFNLTSTLSSIVGTKETPNAINEFQKIKESLGPMPTSISFDGPMASIVTVPLHSQFDVPAVYLSEGLNPRKLTLFRHLLSARRNLYVIHAGSGAEETFNALQHELSNFGFTLEKHLTQAITLMTYDYFCQEWRPGNSLRALYIPPGLNGLCKKEISYPVSIWKLNVQYSYLDRNESKPS